MVSFKGHFDGKVIVPDEPLTIPANQRLLVVVEPEKKEQHTDFHAWIGIGNKGPKNPNPRFKSDDDLWE